MCLALASRAPCQEIEYSSLNDLLTQGSEAFQSGQYTRAAQSFNQIRDEYAEEPEWTKGELPAKLLPLAGFASLRAGDYASASAALESYFSEYTPDALAGPQDFQRYTLALSYLKSGRDTEARDAFHEMRTSASTPSLAGIAAICEARLLSPDEARQLLRSTIDSAPSPRVLTQARIAFIRSALETEAPDAAVDELLRADWDNTSMPELAALSFLAFQIGDKLSEADPARALAAFRLVTPRDRLIDEQQARLQELETVLHDRAPTLGPDQSIWIDFYRQIASSLRGQLEQLIAAADYANALDLRKARCFAKLGRSLEAWILLERLSRSGDAESAPLAHRLWIRVARDMKLWNASAVIGRKYVELYPDRDDATEALYWIAQAQMEQESYLAAISTLETLASRATDTSLVAAANYFSGYCNARLARWDAARTSFEAATAVDPKKPVAGQSSIWIGITYFLQGDYDQAKTAFQAVAANPDWSDLHPEAEYRSAAVDYANGDYEAATATLRKWLKSNPRHQRRDEALLLAGESAEAQGDLAVAAERYRAVDSEARELRSSAIQRLVPILLDSGKPRAAAEICEDFCQDSIPLAHVGALHQLWADCQDRSGETDAARETLRHAVNAYGDNPDAQGLAPLLERLSSLPPLDSSEDPKPTLRSRYQLVRIHELERDRNENEANALALAFASDYPIEALPPECLARLGDALVSIGSFETARYLQRIIDRFPESQYVADAYFGLARDANARGKPQEALMYLRTMDQADAAFADKPTSLALKAELLRSLGETTLAQSAYEQILANRSAPPSCKADAIFGLGQIHLDQGDPTAAYGCFQRLFTLYRGETALVAESYLRCIEILSQRSDYTQADSVCSEFLSQQDLAAEPAFAAAQARQTEIRAALSATAPAAHAP